MGRSVGQLVGQLVWKFVCWFGSLQVQKFWAGRAYFGGGLGARINEGRSPDFSVDSVGGRGFFTQAYSGRGRGFFP